MTVPPTKIRALQEAGVLEVHWADGLGARLPFRYVRGQCPCAACVDEITGVRTLDVDALPRDVCPTALDFSGNYALKIAWSDGHNTGLFTWKYLRELAASPEAGEFRQSEA